MLISFIIISCYYFRGPFNIYDKAGLLNRNSEEGKEHLARCSDYTEISFNVVKKCFGELYNLYLTYH